MTNKERVARAAVALDAYESNPESGLEFEDQADLLVHVLADLRHWAAANGIDFDAQAMSAVSLFAGEVVEEM